jgi:MFS family permease
VTAHLPALRWEARLPFFYGWVIVAVGFLNSFMTVAVGWAVGVLALPMVDDLGWSRSAIFGAVTLRAYVGIAVAPFLGRFFDTRRGPRVLTLVAGLAMCASLLPVAYVRQEWQFFVLFGLGGGIASAAQGGQIIGAIVPKWFVRRRGSAMAWASLGSAVSAFVVPPLVQVFIVGFGWRPSWALLASLALLTAAVPAVLLRRQPEDVGLHPDGDASAAVAGERRSGAPQPEVSASLSQAVRTPVFYVLAAALAAGSLSNNGLPISLVALYRDKGLSPEMAVAGFSTYGLFSIIGRFFWGYFVGRFHIRWVLIAVALEGLVTTPLFFVLDGPASLVCAALAGLGIGGQIGFAQLVWPVYFGRLHLGAITGVARPATFLVMGSGAGMMALSADLTGSYNAGLWAIIVSWALAAGGLLLARPQAAKTAVGKP